MLNLSVMAIDASSGDAIGKYSAKLVFSFDLFVMGLFFRSFLVN